MAQILVRRIEEDVLSRLKERAKRNGRSAEAEVRKIISDVVKPEPARPDFSELVRLSMGVEAAHGVRPRRPLTSLIGAGRTKMTTEEINEYIRKLRDEWTDRE